MAKKLIGVMLAFALLAPFAFAIAEENDTVPLNSAARQELKEMQQAAVQIRQEDRNEIATLRDELHSALEKKREEIRSEWASKKDELVGLREEWQAKFKLQVAKIKDANKASLVEKINNQIASLNEKLSEIFAKQIDQLQDVLERISERADKALAKGVDIAAVKTAVDAAKVKIGEALAAMEKQKAKLYSITISTEANAKKDIAAVRQTFVADLGVVKEAIRLARANVHAAAVALAKAVGTETGSGNSSSTVSSTIEND